MILQVRVKFPSDYPVIYKTIRLDNSLTVQEAILAIGEAINVTPSSDLGLFLPDETKCLADTSLLSSYEQFPNAQYIELKSKKTSKNNSGCCVIIPGYPVVPSEADLACSVNLCSKRGEVCSTGNISSGFECYVQDRCLNGRCQDGLPEGSHCNNSVDCDFGFSCIPENDGKRYCSKAFYVEFNGSCNRTLDCTYSLECINNKCSTPINGCYNDLQCGINEICINKTCQEYILKENECFIYKSFSCKKELQSCTLKDFKSSSIGQCIEKVPEGTPCLTTKYSCDWNLGQFCQPLEVGSVIGKCLNSGKNKFNTCITRRGCGDNEYCKCDANSGVGYCVIFGTFVGSYCREASSRYVNCFLNSSCSQPFSSNPYSCVIEKCREEANCFITFCTEKLLPFDICSDITCNLPLFDTNLSNTNDNNFINLNLVLFNLFIIFIYFIIL